MVTAILIFLLVFPLNSVELGLLQKSVHLMMLKKEEILLIV